MANFLQWNCQGYRTHVEELKLILSRWQPLVCCLQETCFRPASQQTLRGYSFFRRDLAPDFRAHGGVAVLVHTSVPCQKMNIRTTLQAVAVQVSMPMLVTVCSLYLPPDATFGIADLDALVAQLPKPYLLLGDFNSHHTLWGSRHVDAKGRLLEKWVAGGEVCLMNTRDPTHLNVANGAWSSIDLSFCSRAIPSHFQWSVLGDLHGSDHLPILVKHLGRSCGDVAKPAHWIMAKADWAKFSSLVSFQDSVEDFDDVGSA